MDNPRIKIRCPKCQNDGTARAELTNRRVSCKVCEHIFRAVPITDEVSTPAFRPNPTSSSSISPAPSASSLGSNSKPSKTKLEALELEIRRLREDLSTEAPSADEFEALRVKLDQALDAVKKAEAREAALRKEVDELRDQLDQTISTTGEDPKNGLREEELRFLRDQLDKARSEAEAEARRRRETAQAFTAKEAEHVKALNARNADHAQALLAKESDFNQKLSAKQAEHADIVRGLRDQLDRAQAETKAVESRRLAAESARTGAESRHADEVRGLREELGRTQASLDEARKALDGLRLDRENAAADHTRMVNDLKGQIANLEARLKDAEGIRIHRDQLGQELESHKGRLSETERLVAEHRESAEGFRAERDRIAAAHAAELADLRDQLEKTRAAALAEFDSIRRERDEARIQRDRLSEELDYLKATLRQAEQRADYIGYASTELDVPAAVEDDMSHDSETDAESATVYDGDTTELRAEYDRSRAEAERLAAELSEVTDRLNQKDVELADLARERNRVEVAAREAGLIEGQQVADREKAEAENLRRELEKARAATEAAARTNQDLAARVQQLETAPNPTLMTGPTAAAGIDPAVLEAERKRAVDEAVKGAWADFERRLAETQAKLKAANTRADLLEIQA